MSNDSSIDTAYADAYKGYRQLKKGEKALGRGKQDATIRHLTLALEQFSTAKDCFGAASDALYRELADDLAAGNDQLQQCLNEVMAGNLEAGAAHLEKADDCYDAGLDRID